MKSIEKKIWPQFFVKAKNRQKNVEVRLADFNIAKGDTLVLREWNTKRKGYTGRALRRKVRAVHKVDMTKFHSLAKIKRYGLYAIELQ